MERVKAGDWRQGTGDWRQEEGATLRAGDLARLQERSRGTGVGSRKPGRKGDLPKGMVSKEKEEKVRN
jgi:hypothetical protein